MLSPRTILGATALAVVAAVALVIVLNTGARPAVVSAQDPSNDATLSALTVSPKDIIGFTASRTSYEVGVASTVTQATVSATPNDSDAEFEIEPADADTGTPGHQVDLTAGRNEVTITVAAEDNNTTKEYTVSVNRGVTALYGWNAGKDLDGLIAAGNDSPAGIWSDDTTIWVVNTEDNRIYAYTLSTGARDSAKGFDTLSPNVNPYGIWSNGTTMWVLDNTDDKIYAYTLSTGDRDSSKDFDLHSDNGNSRSIWSNGTTMWVVDDTDPKLYAYALSDGDHDSSKELDLHSDNGSPRGIWSNGTTMWVTDISDDKIYAYTLSSGARDSAKDFDTLDGAGNNTPTDIWSDGTTMWAADFADDKVYSYNLAEASDDATLSALTVSPRDIVGFDAERTSYQVGVAATVTQATVSATANHSGASVAITPADADTGTPGHQVGLSAGRNTITITVTAEDGSEEEYTVSVNRGVTDAYGWKAVDDLDGLIAAENESPTGMWSNGTTMWVADLTDDMLYAYNLSTGARDSAKEFDLVAPQNADPNGIWSNGTTMWVADRVDAKLYAYTLSSGARDSAKDFDTLDDAGNASPIDIWSDGTTMWVGDSFEVKLYAYDLSSKAHDGDKDVDTLFDANNTSPFGIWSNGTTMWVADLSDDKLYAYNLSSGARDGDKDFDTLSAAGNQDTTGIWSNGTTMWVADRADDKVYSYNMAVTQTVSDDATLSTLTVSPKDIIGFDADRTSYQVGVASTVTQATVSATVNDSGASVVITPADADTGTAGHQVDLSAGRNAVTVTVTAEDGNTEEEYTVSVNRGVTDVYGWKAVDDLDGLIAAGNDAPVGLWSDGTTMWVVDIAADKLEAYNLSTKARDSSKDFDTLDDASNNAPAGLWSDGTTMWVADGTDDKLYAYNLSTKARDSSKDFNTLLDADNNSPAGLWSDGTTMWVADSIDDKLYAYNLSTKARDSSKDFNTLDDAGNNIPYGLWSDGTTMWVADNDDSKLYAYNLSTKARDSSKDFNTLSAAGNGSIWGIWSDGTTMWVADNDDYKVYSYNMALSDDATLSALTVSPKDIIGFDADRTSYQVGVASTVTQATVSATANDSGASVAITPADADTGTEGHQVDLSAGRNVISITVTAEDGNTEETYTVSVNRGVTDVYGWKAVDDLDGLIAAENGDPTGIWSDETTMWVADSDDDKLYAYTLSSGARDSAKDVTLHTDNDDPTGIWSDDTTIWVADDNDAKIYAYTLADGARDSAKDVTLHTDNDDPTGIWSDDTTIWVADDTDAKIYAYTLSSGARDSAKDVTLHTDNDDPTGIWSDGTTIWVADNTDDKIYAYTLADGARDSDKDFGTLSGAGNDDPTGLWSNGTTMWTADQSDGKVYSYNMAVTQTVSDDATLSALAVSPKDIIGFDAERDSYEVGVASTVTEATVSATANDSGASVEIEPADADTGTPGHQVDLSAGRNAVTITVTAEDDTEETYTVSVNRGVTDAYGWKAVDDLDGLIAAENDFPTGIWSDGTTMWVADLTDDQIYAYNLSSGARDGDKDFDTLIGAGNQSPFGMWSNGTTMWVSDSADDQIYAYRMSDKARDSDKDFDTLGGAGNNQPKAIWSDGTTMWVSDETDRKLYAYNMSDKAHDATKDFDTLDDAGNQDPYGIWSDGTTMWVADYSDDKLYAYTLSTMARDSSKDFDTLRASGSDQTADIWSDGATMWALSFGDKKVYSYNMPASGGDATLSALTVSPKDIIGFDPDRTSYEVGVASAVTQVTVSATANDSGASVNIAPASRVDLSAGRNAVTITVTAEDDTTKEYTVSVNRGVNTAYGWKAADDLDGLIAAENNNPRGAWSNGTTMWVADRDDAYIYAYNLSTGTEDRPKGIYDPGIEGNNSPTGIWSNGTTMWVADATDDKLYAYCMSNKARDSGKEFNDLGMAGNNSPTGIWSDGTTMWVADTTDDKLYAYRMSDKARDSSKDFNNLSGAGNESPTGIWSDGTTMWVVDVDDGKIYAYNMSDKARDSEKDFNTLGAAGNGSPAGIWSDGATMWAADYSDDKVYSYHTAFVLANARLSDLQVDGATVPNFHPLRREFDLVKTESGELTIATTPANELSRVSIYPADSNPQRPGHQVSRSQATAVVMVTVTAPAGNSMTYTIRVPAPCHDDMGHGRVAFDESDNACVILDLAIVSVPGGSTIQQTIDGLNARNGWSVVGSSSLFGLVYGQYSPDTLTLEQLDAQLRQIQGRSWAHRATRETLAHPAGSDRQNSPAIGEPAISGTTEVGGTLTADTAGIGDADGLESTSFTYRWIRTAEGADTEIEDATGASYTVTDRDAGHRLKVRVSFIDDANNQESVTSAATTTIAAPSGQNNAATGAPAVSGTVQVGQTLTADTSGIADEDGLDNAVFSYQWVRGDGGIDADIPDATGSTYTLADADAGMAIRVRVSFTDDAGNEETLTSEATAAVLGMLIATIHGAPESHDGQNSFTFELRLSEEPETDFSYRTLRDHAFRVTGGTVTKARRLEKPSNVRWEITVEPSSDSDISVVLPETTDCADQGGICTEDGRVLSGEAALSVAGPVEEEEDPAPPENNPATGAPAISGTARVGETLTADTSGIQDEDGLTNAVFSYQWVSNDGTADADIPDATDSSYTLLPADYSKTIKVRVFFTDDAGNEETATSGATDEVSAIWAATLQVGSGEDGEGTVFLGYTGFREDWGSISPSYFGLDEKSYFVSVLLHGRSELHFGLSGELETSLTLIVGSQTFTTGEASCRLRGAYQYSWEEAELDWTAGEDVQVALVRADEPTTQPECNRPATGSPRIAGTAQVGGTLTADTAGISDGNGVTNATFTYQWIRVDTDSTETDISGATGSEYTLVAADQGKTIKVRVSFTDDAGYDETLTSVGTAEVEVPLTAFFDDTPSSHDGQTDFTFELRFSEEFELSFRTLRDQAFTVTGGAVDKARRLTQESNVGWQITVRPDGEADVAVTLPATTDCTADGAICTEDGRMLSNSNDFTVSRSGG